MGILNALERLGIRADKADKSRNIAAVMVTADIGPSRRRVPEWMSPFRLSVMQIPYRRRPPTDPMFGADGTVYSVAQGPVSIGGLSAGNAGGPMFKSIPYSRNRDNGALVERKSKVRFYRVIPLI